MEKKFKIIGNRHLPVHLGLFFSDESTQPGGVVGGIDFDSGDTFGKPKLADWLVVNPDMVESIQEDGKPRIIQ